MKMLTEPHLLQIAETKPQGSQIRHHPLLGFIFLCMHSTNMTGDKPRQSPTSTKNSLDFGGMQMVQRLLNVSAHQVRVCHRSKGFIFSSPSPGRLIHSAGLWTISMVNAQNSYIYVATWNLFS